MINNTRRLLQIILLPQSIVKVFRLQPFLLEKCYTNIPCVLVYKTFSVLFKRYGKQCWSSSSPTSRHCTSGRLPWWTVVFVAIEVLHEDRELSGAGLSTAPLSTRTPTWLSRDDTGYQLGLSEKQRGNATCGGTTSIRLGTLHHAHKPLSLAKLVLSSTACIYRTNIPTHLCVFGFECRVHFPVSLTKPLPTLPSSSPCSLMRRGSGCTTRSVGLSNAFQ